MIDRCCKIAVVLIAGLSLLPGCGAESGGGNSQSPATTTLNPQQALSPQETAAIEQQVQNNPNIPADLKPKAIADAQREAMLKAQRQSAGQR